MKVFVYRDGGRILPLRKVAVSISTDANILLDKSRMFAGPFFAKRLARRIARMKRRAALMQSHHEGYDFNGEPVGLKS